MNFKVTVARWPNILWPAKCPRENQQDFRSEAFPYMGSVSVKLLFTSECRHPYNSPAKHGEVDKIHALIGCRVREHSHENGPVNILPLNKTWPTERQFVFLSATVNIRQGIIIFEYSEVELLIQDSIL